MKRKLFILLGIAVLVALLCSHGPSARERFIETCEQSRVETGYESRFSCVDLYHMTYGGDR